jgi:hypothetical protein
MMEEAGGMMCVHAVVAVYKHTMKVVIQRLVQL